MPCAFNLSAVLTELATAPLMRPLIFASSSMNTLAVDPEPTPIQASLTTCLIASRATASFCSSWVMRARRSFLSRRRQIGADAFEQLRCEPDRLGKRRMRMDRAADIDGVSAHLDGKRDFTHQIAGVRSDDPAADDPMRGVVEQQLGEALIATIGDRAAGGGPRKYRLLQLDALRDRKSVV